MSWVWSAARAMRRRAARGRAQARAHEGSRETGRREQRLAELAVLVSFLYFWI